MVEEKISWIAKDRAPSKKTQNWYWVIGILAVGGAAASTIAQNYLFAVLLIVGGFAVMLAGSKGNTKYTFSINEKGVRIGQQFVPFEKIKRFSILEDEDPILLTLDIQSFSGLTTVPILKADYREVRTLLKNKSIDEEEDLRSATDHFARMVGM